MTPEIEYWMAHIARSFVACPGRVLEIGSFNVNGTVRQYFSDADEYVGTDQNKGPNVDKVLHNSHIASAFGPRAFDTVIACEVLEHDEAFYTTLWQLHYVLKAQGILIVTTPTIGFPLHRYPYDYWRFTEDAYRHVFFRGMDILDLRHLDNAAGPKLTLAGIARASP